MIKVLFVCHGNICRSPMAEFLMKKMVADSGISDRFEIASAAVSREELGNPVYPPAREILRREGIDCSGKYARQMTAKDYEYYDYLICMDNSNLRNMLRITGGDPGKKMFKLMDFTDTPGEVSDPWYTGNFEVTRCDILAGLRGFLQKQPINRRIKEITK
ncbi:MAG: low molecular weight phosphotyrosine protein phosphatase [Lentisphaeria bacterium]|nr:low molecular weight phosphotyrosine protein phosphatase [Lentisphaeria bacterium]